MTIKDILTNNLTKNQHAQLMYAFEHGMQQYIEFSPGRYIGVNCDFIRHLEPTITVGKWSSGVVKRKE